MNYKKPDFPLVKGDMIGIAYNNKIYKAIFIKYGKKDNLNFFLFIHGRYYKNNPEDRPKTLPLSYIATNANNRIVKINQDTLSFTDNIDYTDSVDILKYYNIL